MHEMTVKTVEVRYIGESGTRLDQPHIAGEFVVEHLKTLDSDQEHFGILALDGRHRLLGIKVLSNGNDRETPVDAAKLFRTAIIMGATGIILFHNHPSGDLQPSPQDLDLTRRLCEGGRLIGISVHDHFLTVPAPEGGRWLSLRSSHSEVFGWAV